MSLKPALVSQKTVGNEFFGNTNFKNPGGEKGQNGNPRA